MTETAPKVRKPLFKRLVKWFFLMLVLTLGAGIGGYHWFFDPVRFGNFIETIIEDETGADVEINQAVIDWNGEIVIDQLTVRIPGLVGESGRLFETDRMRLKYSIGKFYRHEMPIEQVTIGNRGTLWVTDDEETQAFLFEKLNQSEETGPQKDTGEVSVQHWPSVSINELSIVRGRVYQGKYQKLDQVTFTMDLRPDLDEEDRVVFFANLPVAEQERLSLGEGLVSSDFAVDGTYDLNEVAWVVNMKGLLLNDSTSDWMPIEWKQMLEKALASQPGDGFEQVIAAYRPSGEFPALTFEDDPKQGIRVTFDLKPIEVRLPVLNPEPMKTISYDRFDHEFIAACPIDAVLESGQITFSQDQIFLKEVKALIRPVGPDVPENFVAPRFVLNGSWESLSLDAAFDLQVQTEWFTLTDNEHLLLAMPPDVQELFTLMRPRGEARIQAKLKRDRQTGALTYHGKAEARKTKLLYKVFPYPIKDTEVSLTFDQDGLIIERMAGQTPHGSPFEAKGKIVPDLSQGFPNYAYPAVNIDLVVMGGHIDQYLYRAADSDVREALDLFFNLPARDDLIEKGFLDQNTDEARYFPLEAQANFKVLIEREVGRGDKLNVDVAMDFLGGNLLFEYFPYPAQIKSGKLAVVDNQVVVSDIRLEGLYGGEMKVDGRVGIEKTRVTPDVRVNVVSLPLSDALQDTLPQEAQDWLTEIKAQGQVTVDAHILSHETHDFDAQVDIRFNELVATPSDAFAFKKIKGHLKVTRDDLSFEDLTGMHGDSRFKVSGKVDWTDDHVKLQAIGELEQFKLEGAILKAFAEHAGVVKQIDYVENMLSPRGMFNAQFSVALSDGEVEDYRFEMRPQYLSLKYKEQDIDLKDMSGAFIFQQDRADIRALSGRFDGGEFKTTATLSLGDDPQVNATMEVDVEEFKSFHKKLLPQALVSLMSDIDLQTSKGFKVSIPSLTLRPGAQKAPEMEVKGVVKMEDASLMVATDFKNLDGELAFEVVQHVKWAYPNVRLFLKAKQVEVKERQIEGLETLIITSDEKGRQYTGSGRFLKIESLRGKISGGGMEGTGLLDLREKNYSLTMAVSEVDLKLLGDAGVEALTGRAKEGATQPEDNNAVANRRKIKGRLSGNLTMEGKWTDRSTMKGRGSILVRDAVMYDLPLTMGLLQLINLSLPVSNSFSRANISYLIRGNRVTFDRLQFSSQNLALRGRGWLDYKAEKVKLIFNSTNPRGLDLGPLTTMLDGIKSEFLEIEVVGTFDSPQTRLRQFNTVTQTWDEIVGGVQPKSR